MLRSIGKQSGESVESARKKKRKATVGRICRKGTFYAWNETVSAAALFFNYIFNDFFETNCRTIHQTDFYESLRDGKTLVAVDERSEVIFFRSIMGRCHDNQFSVD